MAGDDQTRYRDEKGQLIGGTTAQAPGIRQGDDLQGLVDATSAEEAAAALADPRRDDESQPGTTSTEQGGS